MKFQNMKIEINDQQPLDEVVSELERLGYKKRCTTVGKPRFVTTECNGLYDIFFMDYYARKAETTLAELKDLEAERHG